ncbi:homoserine lactone transporter (plasmid) [Priestia filamentosa]|uniref:Homoserine lactone transporter n=1 Tax=Priestia filamentosa TaxID=1402861 RepID=A0A2S1LZT1_9BACI|nr:LysE family translocator [Priestia filamentosa]AWG44324.1 homoserine lactone transporter [Priestia filamentosa]
MFGIIDFKVFLISTFLLIVTPGTDTLYILSRSISQGKKAGIYSTLGIITGVFIHTLLAAFGLSLILMKSALLFTIIKFVGMAYLVYLGIKMLLTKKTTVAEQPVLDHLSSKKMYLQGMITNVTNPKVVLFFLAFIPQFINSGGSTPLSFIILGLIYSLIGGLWCLTIAMFASKLTNKLRKSAKPEYILNKITGVVFITMGLKLLTTKAHQ